MKCYFENATSLQAAIDLVAQDLSMTLADSDHAELWIRAEEAEEDILQVSLSERHAVIRYHGTARFLRGLAMLLQWVQDGETDRTITENPLFTVNGAMVDMSRNAVMNVATVQFMLRKMALMGQNAFMLYTEDTYEVPERPYFGHLRGRYTQEELRTLDAYAATLGIELIPCVQMLGHLATMLRWSVTAPYKDSASALLVGAEETYAFLDDLLRSISASFTSRRLHMGMDETHDLGIGNYLDRFGYKERSELYFSHLRRVAEMAKSYGFRPMMWSDMFFRLAGKDLPNYRDYDPRVVIPENISDYLPDGVQQVFWDYYQPDEAFYADNLKKHELLGENTMYAGGIWTWSGHCPHFSRSLISTIPALHACKKQEVKEVVATIWHNGAESCMILALAGLAAYASFDYSGCWDEAKIRETFRFACGEDYDAFMQTELPEYPHGGPVGASRALLYNDPLLGVVDKHFVDVDTQSYYAHTTKTLQAAMPKDPYYAPAYDVLCKLCAVLKQKGDFGIRLKKAYDMKDRETLAALAGLCDSIMERLLALREAHRKAWMTYHKPFGWEVFDIRYGGLIMRFETAKHQIAAYLSGEIDAIEELEAERLRVDCAPDTAEPVSGVLLWKQYASYATAGIL